LVLPVPPVDFITKAPNSQASAYPSVQCGGAIATTTAMSVPKCGPRATTAQACPNGDFRFGGGCVAATSDGTNTYCTARATDNSAVGTNVIYDARVYNLTLTNGTTGYSTFTITAVPVTLPFTGDFGRIHADTVLYDKLNAGTYHGTTCQQLDATEQLGCLAQANPCSVAYAGHGAANWGAHNLNGSGMVPSNNQPLRVSQILPTTASVQTGVYPLWRKIYFNSSPGFDYVAALATDGGPGSTYAAEMGLANYEANTTSITGILSQFDFFSLGANSPNGTDTPFCEDFNEEMLNCTGHGANQNACAYNVGLPQFVPAAANAANFAPIAATDSGLAPDANPTGTSQGGSTVCGNGIVEAFEDCDNGGSNGSLPATCSVTCRTNFP
jgi:hypothetical protein